MVEAARKGRQRQEKYSSSRLKRGGLWEQARMRKLYSGDQPVQHVNFEIDSSSQQHWVVLVDILVGIPAAEDKYFEPALDIPGYIGILLAQDALEVVHTGFVWQ